MSMESAPILSPMDVEAQHHIEKTTTTTTARRTFSNPLGWSRKALGGAVVASALLAIGAVIALTASQTKTIDTPDAFDRRLGGRVAIGAHTPGSIGSLEGQLGRHFDVSMMYSSIGAASNLIASFKGDMDSGHDIVLNLDFDSSLDDINGGRYDGDIDNFVHTLNQVKGRGGQKIWLRVLHEFNGDWYSWSVHHSGNSKDKFKSAYRHIVQRLKDGTNYDGNIKYQLGYNCDNPGAYAGDSFGSMYPGSDVVDGISCNAYNRNGLAYHYNDWESFSSIFSGGYQRMLSIGSGKPLAIGEISTVSHGGDKPDWIRDVAYKLRDNFPAVTQIDWFLENSQGDWALNSDSDKQAMRDFMDDAP